MWQKQKIAFINLIISHALSTYITNPFWIQKFYMLIITLICTVIWNKPIKFLVIFVLICFFYCPQRYKKANVTLIEISYRSEHSKHHFTNYHFFIGQSLSWVVFETGPPNHAANALPILLQRLMYECSKVCSFWGHR